MRFHVYYHDYYEEFGIESFNTQNEALSFISKRLQENQSSVINYTLIEGRILSLEVVEQVTRVQVKHGES